MSSLFGQRDLDSIDNLTDNGLSFHTPSGPSIADPDEYFRGVVDPRYEQRIAEAKRDYVEDFTRTRINDPITPVIKAQIEQLQAELDNIVEKDEEADAVLDLFGGYEGMRAFMKQHGQRYQRITKEAKRQLDIANSRFMGRYDQEYKRNPKSVTEIVSMETSCCELKCNWNLSVLDVLIARNFLPVQKHGQTAIKDLVGPMIMQMPGDELVVNGHVVCGLLFSWIYFVPRLWLAEVLTRKSNGSHTLPLDLRKMGKPVHKKTFDRQAKMFAFSKSVCDPSPSAETLMVPPHFRRSTFVNEGLQEFDDNDKLITHSTRTAKNILKNMGVKVAFDSGNNLPKCNICVELKAAGERTFDIDGTPISAKEVLRDHRDNVIADRIWDARVCAESMNFPNSALVIKFDGMSKMKTALPSLYKMNSKKVAAVTEKLDYHLHAAIVCRNEPESVVKGYVNAYFVPNSLDANRVASLFYDTLLSVEVIPPKIYIQVDNATTNKGKVTIHALARLLQYLPTVQNITIMCLPVGHTHNEVDAFFGIVANQLRGKDIVTPNQMKELVNGISGVRQVSDDFTVWNFKGERNRVPDNVIMNIHYFEVFRHDDGIRFRCKQYIRVQDYVNLNERIGRTRGESDPYSRLLIPNASPIEFPHRLCVNMDKARQSLRELKTSLTRTFPAELTEMELWVIERESFEPVALSQVVADLRVKTTNAPFNGLRDNAENRIRGFLTMNAAQNAQTVRQFREQQAELAEQRDAEHDEILSIVDDTEPTTNEAQLNELFSQITTSNANGNAMDPGTRQNLGQENDDIINDAETADYVPSVLSDRSRSTRGDIASQASRRSQRTRTKSDRPGANSPNKPFRFD